MDGRPDLGNDRRTPMKSGVTPSQRRYVFKQAETPQEFADIHRLLYRTFVVEIPRYDDPGTEYLVDKYHERNTYFVASCNGRVCGMIAVHGEPPYSIAAALDDPNILQSLGPHLLEARILAVEPQQRFGLVFAGIASCVFDYAKSGSYRYIVITGFAQLQRMYEQLGFHALGPPALRGNEYFVPMALDLCQISSRACRNLTRWNERQKALVTVS